MKKQILFVLLISFLAFIGCQSNTSTKAKSDQIPESPAVEKIETSAKIGEMAGCSTEEAMKLILALKEVEESKRNLDSLTDHKANISFMIDSLKQGGRELYSLTAGYNSEERFEPYYHFYLNKSDCKNIQILDIVSGEYLPLEAWRKQNRN
ncbi:MULTISPECIES: hypothetical protein [Sphingobacterium]|uniref:DUF3347 domain-containing protein n=1 Tax=Sphingobacterium ginsenosidimutans TaxID=687845 RepID=A0ABP8ANE9_9SPHI|nr:hypothetical protein [Sphingobacterium sp. E70]ULT27862.1 hypothetical protein KUH03_15225 [Sphingobacterium sp. E70]